MITGIEEHEYKKFLLKCCPLTKLIAPFGFNWWEEIPINPNVKIITNKDFKERFYDAKVRIWNKHHAKLAIGENGILFGSWNFNLEHNGKSTRRELVSFIKPTDPEYQQLNQWFDQEWDYCKQWQESE